MDMNGNVKSAARVLDILLALVYELRELGNWYAAKRE